jgi:iron-sulfur cluster assembly accessory protein
VATTLTSIGSKKKSTSMADVMAQPGAVVGLVDGNVPKEAVAMTDRAAKKILQLAEREGKTGQVLRVGIQGGGCSGLSYTFSFTNGPDSHDKAFAGFGATIVVDPKSMRFLGGTVLDWQESLMKSGFVLKNPNEVKNCSCGESFSI